VLAQFLRLTECDPRDEEEEAAAEPTEAMEHVTVDIHDPDRVLKIGSQLEPELKTQMIDFLRSNLDVFAWTHANMTSISPEIACHALNINPSNPVKQRKRSMGLERSAALDEEVKNLLANDFIRESIYPDWIANPVLVKKPNGKWRTCIDFSNLNDACPKDCFPIPRIN